MHFVWVLHCCQTYPFLNFWYFIFSVQVLYYWTFCLDEVFVSLLHLSSVTVKQLKYRLQASDSNIVHCSWIFYSLLFNYLIFLNLSPSFLLLTTFSATAMVLALSPDTGQCAVDSAMLCWANVVYLLGSKLTITFELLLLSSSTSCLGCEITVSQHPPCCYSVYFVFSTNLQRYLSY